LLDVFAGCQPWSSADRFGGTIHPNAMSVYCGMAALAAYVLSWNSQRKWVWISLFAICVVLLLLTKSRTTLFVFAVTLTAGWFLSLPSRLRWCSIVAGFTLCGVALLLVGAVGSTVVEPVVDTVLLGRHDKVETLSGRIPLWEMLLEDVGRQPWLGHGFSSFWTTSKIEEVSQEQQWAITSAHSVYLELMLGIGFLGMLLATSVVVVGASIAMRKYTETHDVGYAFILLLLVFGLANGLLESTFAKPQLTTVLAFCGLAALAFFNTKFSAYDSEGRVSEDRDSERMSTYATG
jgi:O-antigen ligase